MTSVLNFSTFLLTIHYEELKRKNSCKFFFIEDLFREFYLFQSLRFL